MKKKLFLFMTICLLIGMNTFAYDAKIDGIYYIFTGDQATVTYGSSSSGSYSDNVVIPASVTYNGKTYTVTTIDGYAFKDCYLQSLTIGPYIRTIYNYNEGLKSTKVIWLTNTPPSGYTNVKGEVNYASNNLYSDLSNVHVYPFLSSLFEVDGVKYVPVSPSERTCDAIDCAYNESAENLNIGEYVTNKGISLAVKEIKEYAFYKNNYIKKIYLNNQGKIGKFAFYNCTKLYEATISNHGNIGSSAFAYCTNLDKAKVYNYGSLDYQSFCKCTALQVAELGDNITSIDSRAFDSCSKLKSITIPNSVTYLGSYVFEDCSAMTSAKIGNGVTSISESTFRKCSSLQDVQIGTGVTSIKYDAFYGCTSLPIILIPKNVTSIGSYTFQLCTSLKTVLMDNGEETLTLSSNGSSPLFVDCPLDSVYIGRNISYPTSSDKGYSPFYRNSKLRSVTITDRETEISENEFYGCINLKNVRIGNGVTTFGNWAFSGCYNLDYFSFGSSVKTIGKEAFSDCTAMTKLISKAITPPQCGTQALDDINKWECTLYVPDESIPTYQSASQWKEFFFIEELSSSATVLASSISLNQTVLSFDGANQTTTLTATVVPANTTNKKVSWTSSNTSVATVSNEGVVTSRGNGTAIITATTSDGTNLTATCTVTVTIVDDSIINFADANVKIICVANWDKNKDGELSKSEAAAVKYLGSVFKNNQQIVSFKELQYFTSVTSIGNYAFEKCSSLTSITIPNSVTSIGYFAFENCI